MFEKIHRFDPQSAAKWLKSLAHVFGTLPARRNVRRAKTALFLGLASGLLGILLSSSEIASSLEKELGLGWLFTARGAVEAPPDFVVVAIDRQSSGASGLPNNLIYWPRGLHAILVDKLVEAGASVIAMDIAFFESNEERDPKILYHLGLLDPKILYHLGLLHENAFTQNKGRAYLYYSLAADRGHRDALSATQRIEREWGRMPLSRERLNKYFADVDPLAEDKVLAHSIKRSQRVILFQHIETTAGVWLKRDPPRVLRTAALGMGPWVLPKDSSRLHQFWSFKADETTPDTQEVPTLPTLAFQIHTLPLLKQFLTTVESHDGESTRLTAGELRDIRELLSLLDNIQRHLEASPELSQSHLVELMQRLRTHAALSQRLLVALDSDASRAIPNIGRAHLRALLELYLGTNLRYLNFYGPPGSVTTIPYHEVLLADDLTHHGFDLTDRVVFVGAVELQSTEQKDAFYTHYTDEAKGIDLSGVEIAATAFGNMLKGSTLKNVTFPTNALAVFVLGALVATSSYLFSLGRGLAISVGSILGYFAVAVMIFAKYHLMLPVFIPLAIQAPLAAFVGLMCRYHVTKRERENLSRGIREHMPSDVADAVAEQGTSVSMNRVEYGVCLLADAQGFTTFSEHIEPQRMQSLISHYFEMMGQNVVRYDGTIINMLADSMCCFWSLESDEETNRLKACQAAITICRESDSGDRQSLRPRLGLHVGTVAVGKVGGAGRFDFTVVGDPVNTGSRIEALNKKLGTTILASDSVVSGLQGIQTRCMGSFILRGKTKPVRVFQIFGERGSMDSVNRLCREFAAALSMFEAGLWDDAAARFEAILTESPGDGPCVFYLALCRSYLAQKPSTDEPWIIRMDDDMRWLDR